MSQAGESGDQSKRELLSSQPHCGVRLLGEGELALSLEKDGGATETSLSLEEVCRKSIRRKGEVKGQIKRGQLEGG